MLGQSIDGGPVVYADKYLPITANPSFEDQQVEPEMFVTGIKVIDLVAPYMKGGKSVCSGSRVGKQSDQELINNIATEAEGLSVLPESEKDQGRQ